MRQSPHSRFAGERVSIPERMIVAPGNGIFRLTALTYSGAYVGKGDEIGVVESPGASASVRSPFSGTLMGIMALEGERLREGEPVAWLRVA
jgi:biotin carboxyl carrier protein